MDNSSTNSDASNSDADDADGDGVMNDDCDSIRKSFVSLFRSHKSLFLIYTLTNPFFLLVIA